MEVEDGAGRVSSNFPEEFADSLRFGGELEVVNERSVEIDGVEGFEARRILDQRGRSSYRVYKPRFAPDIPRVEGSLALTFKYCNSKVSRWPAQLSEAKAYRT